jgi:hypothetical protein
MKTRTKGSAKAATETTESTKSTAPKVQLGPDSTNPPHIFILPEDICKDARIVSLENPSCLTESRYVVCPERGFYEFTNFASPRTTPRSWLLSAQESTSAKDPVKESVVEETKNKEASKGYVMRTANLLIATPIDPLFFVLPALAPLPNSKASEQPKKMFLSSEDYLERIVASSPHLAPFVRTEPIRQLLEKRMAAVSDIVEAGDESMYRLNEERLLEELLRKAKRMVEKGLPPSMEEKLVRKALEAPMLGIKRDESSMHELANEEDGAETTDTQTTASSAQTPATSFSEASTAATSFTEDSETVHKAVPSCPLITALEGVAELLCLRTALFMICSKYLMPHLSEILKTLIASQPSTVDFAPLDSHLAHLAKLRQDALAARSLGDYSRKRALDEDNETRAEKKQKLDEEEKRKKAGESRGVKALKKVNVTGMKKMSDFFKKK